MSDDVLSIWTVYDSPRDYPDVFVARRFECASGVPEPKATAETVISPTLDGVRSELSNRGLFLLGARDEGDDPNIVESWI